MTIALFLSFLALAAWTYLLLFRGQFWLMGERDDTPSESAPAAWPSVTAVVPARDEAEVIALSIGSLVKQDYPGPFRIVLVDDQSRDGTADIAGRLEGQGRLEILPGTAPPAGWTGKLWAVNQGVGHAGAADYLWLTDADIVHSEDNLRRQVMRAESGNLVLTSLMAKLRCESWAERFLIPAFVFFFAMLYPFAWVNRRGSAVAAAAGGCMLIRREALDKAGGLDSVRQEIIDDCALARRLKPVGGIWLGLTTRAVSLRRYPKIADIGGMVSRSAYAELDYSPLRLAGALVGMIVVYVAPLVIAVLPTGAVGLEAGMLASTAGLAMVLAFQPILLFYRRSAFWGLAMPLIGGVYAVFTLDSAIRHWRGRGGMWKGRAQAWTRA
jgi:hopene-associated glycosyltransferase HpnB